MTEFLAVIYVGGKAYAVDTEGYFLLCDLQKSELHQKDGEKVFEAILGWLMRNNKAVKFRHDRPIMFMPKFKKDEEE